MVDVYLTGKQYKVYSYYMEYINKGEETPTYVQASKDLGVSPSAIHNHIKNLCKKGLLFVTPRGEVKDVTDQYSGIDLTPPIIDLEPLTASSNHIKRKFTREDIKWMLSSIMSDPAGCYVDNAIAWFKNYGLFEE